MTRRKYRYLQIIVLSVVSLMVANRSIADDKGYLTIYHGLSIIVGPNPITNGNSDDHYASLTLLDQKGDSAIIFPNYLPIPHLVLSGEWLIAPPLALGLNTEVAMWATQKENRLSYGHHMVISPGLMARLRPITDRAKDKGLYFSAYMGPAFDFSSSRDAMPVKEKVSNRHGFHLGASIGYHFSNRPVACGLEASVTFVHVTSRFSTSLDDYSSYDEVVYNPFFLSLRAGVFFDLHRYSSMHNPVM